MTKQIAVFNDDDFDKFDGCTPHHPIELVNFLNEQIAKIPKEFFDTAKIELSGGSRWDCGCTELKIYYERPETDKEYQDRLAREKASMEMAENRELCELERLRRKYGV